MSYNIGASGTNKAQIKSQLADQMAQTTGNTDTTDLLNYVGAQIDLCHIVGYGIISVHLESDTGFGASGGSATISISVT